MATFSVEIQFKGSKTPVFSAEIEALESKTAESMALLRARKFGYSESVKKFVVRRLEAAA